MSEKGAPPKVGATQRRVLRFVSAFTSPLLPDDYLELINPLWSTRELRGKCVGRLCSGEVRDLRTGKIVGQAGEVVRTCINASEGPVEIEL